MRAGVLRVCALVWAALTFMPSAQAAPFTMNNIAVVRVGNGTTLLSSNSAQVSILEFTPGGAFVQEIPLPTTGNTFSLSGNATSEGKLTNGLIGNTPVLTLAGYGKAPLLSDPAADSGTTTNRVVARVNFDGSVNTSTRLSAPAPGAFSGVSVKGAATSDGTKLWVSGAAGTNGGIQYTTLNSTASTTVGSTANSFNQVRVANGQLFIAGTIAGSSGVYKVGTGLPESGTPAFSSANTTSVSKNYSSFYFTNLGSGNNWSPGGEATGFDTLYAIDTANNNLEKWSFNGTTWVQNSFISSAGILNVAGQTYGKNVVLFITTSNGLNSLLDTAGHNANNNGSVNFLVGTGSAFYQFRGVAVVPEPGSLALCGLAGAGLVGIVLRRRRKALAPAV